MPGPATRLVQCTGGPVNLRLTSPRCLARVCYRATPRSMGPRPFCSERGRLRLLRPRLRLAMWQSLGLWPQEQTSAGRCPASRPPTHLPKTSSSQSVYRIPVRGPSPSSPQVRQQPFASCPDWPSTVAEVSSPHTGSEIRAMSRPNGGRFGRLNRLNGPSSPRAAPQVAARNLISATCLRAADSHPTRSLLATTTSPRVGNRRCTAFAWRA